jgi:flagellar hook-basal body complex protein FliE
MSIEAITAIAPPELMVESSGITPVGPAGQSFGSLVAHGIETVNEQLIASQSQLQHLAVGDVQNLHQAMIGLEEAKMSFQLLMQVRSRALEAYQDVMKMQV